MSALSLGPFRVVPAAPSLLTADLAEVTRLETGRLGFAGATDAAQARWLNAFRCLLDGLDAPLQVLIEINPGPGPRASGDPPVPVDFDEMRSADMWFVDQLSESQSAHIQTTSFITSGKQAPRVEAALRELGVSVRATTATPVAGFGREEPDQLRHSRGWSRTWCAPRIPGTELEAGWLFRLLPRGLNLRLAWHAVPLPAAWIVDYLQRQLTNMRAARMRELSVGTSDPLLAGALPHAENLQRRIAGSQEKAFHVSLYITLSAPTRRALESGSEMVRSAARTTLCELQPCKFRMREAYLATCPAGVDRLARTRVLDTSTLVTFFPWLDADLAQPGGLVVGCSTATGSPVLIDPFDQVRYANANVGVFGSSGAGKTYLLSTLAMGALGLGTQVYIVDPEHEYGGLARRLGGADVRLALGSGHAINVLDLRASDRHDESWLGPATADAVDLCATICGELNESERALVETAVRNAYTAHAQPLLGDVAAALPAGARTTAILGRWVNGSLGQMFSAPTNIDLDAPIVVFGMRELRDEMVAPVHFLLAEALWARIKRKDRRRMLIVDELGLLFEDATIRKFVVSLARRIRKYNGSLVFATQNPGDLLSSDQGAVVATNPAVLLLGAQRPGELAKLEHTFHLSPQQRAFLETARRGDFLLAAGADRMALHVQAPPWQEDAMRRAR